MRTPRRRGVAIDDARFTDWLTYFSCYRRPPTQDHFEDWLKQFSSADRTLAARILDCTEIISETEILQGYKEILSTLPGWHKDADKRKGKWFFLGFGRPSESGEDMLRKFREANGLSNRIYSDLFRSSVELPTLEISSDDTIVFVDDFAGSGKQFSENWPIIKELMASSPKIFLALTSCTEAAKEIIEREGDVKLRTMKVLTESDNVFSEECRFFNTLEKQSIMRYGKKTRSRQPKGYRACGLLFSLSHKTPNNSIPIIHANNKHWLGILPRYLIPEG